VRFFVTWLDEREMTSDGDEPEFYVPPIDAVQRIRERMAHDLAN
jgi:hypothetical protein